MKIEIPAKSQWPLKSAALVSDTTNLHMKLKELIRPLGWKIEDLPALAEESLNYTKNGTSFFYLVEDTPSYSAYEAIRAIQANPVGRMTPILALVHEKSWPDAIIFEKVLHVSAVKKPLTPSDFYNSFRRSVQTWETPLFLTLRKCGYSMLNGQFDPIIPTLEKLRQLPQAVPFAVPVLCKIYIQNNEWKLAESLILDSIKTHPKLPSLLLTVADFYAAGRMPAQAMRFYKKLKAVCNGSSIFSFEIAQSALMLGHLDVAIEAYSDWIKTHPGHDASVQNLARLLLSEGHEAGLEKILHMNKASIKRLMDQWEKAEVVQQQTLAAS